MLANVFDKVFGTSVVVLPVVHVRDAKQALRNMGTAFRAGAHGVFLIDMLAYREPEKLFEIYDKVRAVYWGAWIGLNVLGLQAHEAMERAPQCVSGIWADDGITASEEAVRECQKRSEIDSQFLFFGGVAHKASRYQSSTPEEAENMARFFARRMHVVTTSGPATGHPPDIVKVHVMANAASPTPVAVSSGVDPENVRMYRNAGARAFLVASSIQTDPDSDELDLEKARKFIDAARIG